MIYETIKNRKLSKGVIKYLIIMIYNTGDKENLSNWRPITLVNVVYKVFVNAL
jgi:hypothetical protein